MRTIPLQDVRSLRPQTGHLRALCVFVLLLTRFYEGQSQRTGPPQPIVAMVGDDVILPCQLEHAADAVSMTVEWSRADLNPRFVHLRREGVDLLIDQNPSYIGRTSLSTDKLRRGDLSLKLSRVKLTDEGTYRCFSPTQQRQMEVQLAVASASSPLLRLSKLSGEETGLVLDCESEGRYPEPEVSWLDSEGHVLSAGPPETVRGPDGLYTVSSRVTVEKRHGNRFTCRVQQKTTNQTRETQIHVTDDFFVLPSCSAGRVIIVSAVGFMCVLAVVLGGFIMGHRIKTTMIQDDKTQTGRGSPSQLLIGGREISDREKERHDEERQRNEGDLNEVRQVIDALKDLRTELRTQKENVSLILNEMIDKTMKHESTKSKQERTKKTRAAMLNTADKVIETTEEIFDKMSERKDRLEKDLEQINEKRQNVQLETEYSESEQVK